MKVKNKFARIVLTSDGYQVILIKTWTDDEDVPFGLECTAIKSGVKLTTTLSFVTRAARNLAFKDYSQTQADALYKTFENFS